MYRSFTILFFSIFFIVTNSYAVERYIPREKNAIPSYAELIKAVSPAVVNIYTKKKVMVRTRSPLFRDPFFNRFFGDSLTGPTKEKIQRSLGSGVILDKEGFIVTNHHVVAGSEEVTVVLQDKRELAAKVMLLDKKADLAVLRVEVDDSEELPHLELTDSDDIQVGDFVFAIGNPFGFGQTVTSGIVSALARTTVGVADYEFFIQTDAAVNPGNSGGPLINMEGKVVGINTAIHSSSGGSNGIGFAIPSNLVAAMINGKIENNRVIRPWFGASLQAVSQDIARSLSLKKPTGALVAKLHPDGPAKKAGIKVGDVILKIHNDEVTDEHVLHFKMALYRIGSSVPLEVLRDGKKITLSLKMEAPLEKPARDIRKLEGDHPFERITVANLSPALADELGVDIYAEGVIVLNIETSFFSKTVIQPLDIIQSLNGTAVTSTKQLEALLNDETQNVWKMIVKRGDNIAKIVLSR